ncbi:MAG TPA: hypothetical protein VER96_24970 [Polyangiaceae bacterium]|nr:hypothetical protein [Polyangiaceae bacterium]
MSFVANTNRIYMTLTSRAFNASFALIAVSLSVSTLGIHGCSASDVSNDRGSAGGSRASGSAGHAGYTQPSSGGAFASGGSGTGSAMGGSANTGGSNLGGMGVGGAAGGVSLAGSAGSLGSGGAAHAGAGGQGAGGKGQAGESASGGAAGSTGSGSCTASKSASVTASGSGPHKVTVETNADAGIKEGTIYRPTDLGGSEKYPIFVWGNGACSQDGLSNTAAMAEIASYGYFVIADGTPKGSGSRSQTSNWAAMGKPLLAYVSWAIAENGKSCSAYHGSLDTTKIASNGFSCGGLMSEGTSGDSRMTSVGITSSGLTSADQAFYKTVHTPFLIILGGTSDIAYDNGERDYDSLSALGIPVMLFSKNIGHGGDLGSARGGDFTKINLAWLNWRLKGDEGASGKGVLVGSSCTYCSNSAWEVKSKNIP